MVATLFHPKIVEQELSTYDFPSDLEYRHSLIMKWIASLNRGILDEISEVSLHTDFLKDVFEKVLGYPGPIAGGDEWNLLPEKQTAPGGHYADAVLGYFRKGKVRKIVAAIELKGASTSLDRSMPGRGMTPVQQGWWYAFEAECPWAIISNYREIRLYNRYRTPAVCETFFLADLADIREFRRFLLILSKESLLPGTLLESMLARSEAKEVEVTDALYRDYRNLRTSLFNTIREENPDADGALLLGRAQKLLDRVLFVCFCEDRGLLPAGTIDKVLDQPAIGLTKWDSLRFLFRAIDKGDPPHGIDGYNGGLFAYDPQLDGLVIPDLALDQIRSLNRYDFQSEVGVTILGHIFEQSIEDIEAMQAELRGEQSGRETRRKREGVYYTPPNITQYVVQETLGKYLMEKYQSIYDAHQPDSVRGKNKRKAAWIETLEEYRKYLLNVRVVDPACGSGAFLVAAFDILWSEYNEVNRRLSDLEQGQVSQPSLFDLSKTILSNNLYGVDLNEESVEITKLSLWIKTAMKGKPLTDLDHAIQCGNSIIDDPSVDPKAFAWKDRFPEVFAAGGFDVVVGNPPYIKLQNYRSRHPDEAHWLIEHYESCKTGSFDIYLPFIERSLSLLKPAGRLGFIAPSAWLINDYGKGLRRLVAREKALHRFVDFKSHQVFADATTYTALQFFSKAPNDSVEYAPAPEGDLMVLEGAPTSYKDLDEGPWILLPKEEQELMAHLARAGEPLAHVAERVFVGIQTSADKVYHLHKEGRGRYYSPALGTTVDIEDDIMRPLVSGVDIHRYVMPSTTTYLLFPYDVVLTAAGDRASSLIGEERLRTGYPRAWEYLKQVEGLLRQREQGKMDREGWWAYNYPKNLELQDLPKILLPRLLLRLEASMDIKGRFFLDNVDVGGIRTKSSWNPWYVLAILNSPVATYFWRRKAKPFRGGYRSANRQFISSIPVPSASDDVVGQVSAYAQTLSRLCTLQERIRTRVLHRLVSDLGGRPTRRLEQWHTLTFKEIVEEISTRFGRSIPVGERDAWEAYLTAKRDAIDMAREQIRDSEERLNELIFQLYSLDLGQRKKIIEDEL